MENVWLPNCYGGKIEGIVFTGPDKLIDIF